MRLKLLKISLQKIFAVGLMFITLVFVSSRFAPFYGSFSSVSFSTSTSKEEYVLWNFTSIQEAINKAEIGSVVHVPSGTYYEHVVINKTISLVGENVSTTIIDGSNTATVVTITADNVSISGFTMQNSGYGWTRHGVYVHQANNCRIKNNSLLNVCHSIKLNYSRNSEVLENTINGIMTKPTMYGIRLQNTVNCVVSGNYISDCVGSIHLENATKCTISRNHLTENDQGIRLYSPCVYNSMIANSVFNNTYDGMIEAMPGNTTFFGNIFFHNNFINNTNPFIYKVSGNVWDNGYPSGGNHWSRYIGLDSYKGPYQDETGSDGIGDSPYRVNNFEVDRYPLIHPWSHLPVNNINTGIGYNAIQEAIDTFETSDGHVLWVEPGIYLENVNVYKSLTLAGENQSTTIIDSENVGTVLSVNADNVSIAGFTIRNSGLSFPPYGMDCGIFLNHSVGSKISHCSVMSNRIGIYLFFSRDSVIEYNVVSSNHKNGIWLWYSGNNVLTGNKIANNSYNFGVSGGSLSDFYNTIDTSNTVEGRSIQYLISVEDAIFDNQANIGVLYLINCNNVTVKNLDLTNNVHGVFCFNVTDSKTENVTASDNNYGIYLQSSKNNSVGNSQCLNNWVGICLQDSNNNTVENNVAARCEKGISLYEADYNSVRGNTVPSNLYGIRFYSSHFNEIFHNNLIENTEQVDLISSYINVWDNGFEGNYWSDYNGADVDHDGAGDAPYIIDANNEDHHPLFGVFHSFNASDYHVSVISNSTIEDFGYFESNSTIRICVSNSSIIQTFGFCTVCIPKDLMSPTYTVIIDDGTMEVLNFNDNLRDNGTHRWIYFAYEHSTREILIVPEFRSVVFLSILMVATIWCFLLKRLELNI